MARFLLVTDTVHMHDHVDFEVGPSLPNNIDDASTLLDPTCTSNNLPIPGLRLVPSRRSHAREQLDNHFSMTIEERDRNQSFLACSWIIGTVLPSCAHTDLRGDCRSIGL